MQDVEGRISKLLEKQAEKGIEIGAHKQRMIETFRSGDENAKKTDFLMLAKLIRARWEIERQLVDLISQYPPAK